MTCDCERLLGLVMESYQLLRTQTGRIGRFYRHGKHGLLYRMREALAENGRPAHTLPKPTDSTTLPGPSLRVVEGGRSAKEDEFVNLPSDKWTLRRGEAL